MEFEYIDPVICINCFILLYRNFNLECPIPTIQSVLHTHTPPDKDISTAKEREATLHEDRATLELHWKHSLV